MLVHGLLLERVDLRGLGGSAGGNDVLGERCDRCPEAPGEKDLGALRRKGACYSAADRASGSVDHRNLVLQHHLARSLRTSGGGIAALSVGTRPGLEKIGRAHV